MRCDALCDTLWSHVILEAADVATLKQGNGGAGGDGADSSGVGAAHTHDGMF